MNRRYTYKELIQVYIETLRKHPSDLREEVREYYPRLLSHLEGAFGIRLSWDAASEFDSTKMLFFSLFNNTAHSYKNTCTPWSNYQEAGLLIKRLEEKGEQGKKVLALSNEIYNLTETNRELHLKMLYELFECIYGQHDTVVTSEELRALGFDDSKEPSWLDFED